MEKSKDNGRTHEPSLREVTAELDGIRNLLLSKLDACNAIMDERDRLYKERYESSDKAILKAEEAQRAYNQSHNDLARKMDEQNQATMPRTETENRFKSLEEKIALLTGSFVAGSGAAQGAKAVKDESRANMAIIISLVGVVMAVVAFFVGKAA